MTPADMHNVVTTTAPCQVHLTHTPRCHINERHHIWPLGMGGPDIPSNRIIVCATGHNNIHALLALLVKHKGAVPLDQMRTFGYNERSIAKLGYDRYSRNAM